MLFVSHDNRIFEKAIETINSFIEDSEHCKVWFFDEENNLIKPKGKITGILMMSDSKEEL